MASKGEWPRSYVIPSTLLTLSAAALLIWHVYDPARPIDAWSVTLLIVGFLPWLRTVFESVDFPGGGSVRYRELKATQDRQGDDIRTLAFLTANFLTDVEKTHLRKLAGHEPFPVWDGPRQRDIYAELRRLRSLGLIRQKGDRGVASLQEEGGDVKDVFEISQRGKQYLDLLAQTGEGTEA